MEIFFDNKSGKRIFFATLLAFLDTLNDLFYIISLIVLVQKLLNTSLNFIQVKNLIINVIKLTIIELVWYKAAGHFT